MKLDEKGQALVEFLLFLPFMLMMYSVTLSIGNAINAAINQQKITRAYFYYRVQHNSTVPKPEWSQPTHLAWTTFGMYIIGWKEEFQNEQPMAPCFKIRIPLNNSAEDNCDNSYTQPSSQFIRVATVYGVCGASYVNGNVGVIRLPGGDASNSAMAFTGQGCLIR